MKKQDEGTDDKKISANVDYPITGSGQQGSNAGNENQRTQNSNALSNDLSGSTQFVNLDTKDKQPNTEMPDSENTTEEDLPEDMQEK